MSEELSLVYQRTSQEVRGCPLRAIITDVARTSHHSDRYLKGGTKLEARTHFPRHRCRIYTSEGSACSGIAQPLDFQRKYTLIVSPVNEERGHREKHYRGPHSWPSHAMLTLSGGALPLRHAIGSPR